MFYHFPQYSRALESQGHKYRINKISCSSSSYVQASGPTSRYSINAVEPNIPSAFTSAPSLILLHTKIQNSPPLVPGAGSSRRRQN